MRRLVGALSLLALIGVSGRAPAVGYSCVGVAGGDGCIVCSQDIAVENQDGGSQTCREYLTNCGGGVSGWVSC
jgi:hypothetical protein